MSVDVDLFRWIVGSGLLEAPPDPHFFSELRRLAEGHNLQFRLQQRMYAIEGRESLPEELARPFPLVPHLMRFRLQLNSLAELTAAFYRHCGGQILIMKSPAVYALTGKKIHFPICHDIDMFSDQPAELVEVAQSLGYKAAFEDSRLHHQAVLTKGPVVFELHRHFSSWAYPIDFGDIFAEQAISGSRPLIADPTAFHIRWADLAPHCTDSAVKGFERVLIPTAVLAAAVSCVHLFKEVILPGNWKMRFSELALIKDMMDHPTFSKDAFCEHIETFEAQHAATFVAAAIRYWYGTAPEWLNAKYLGAVGSLLKTRATPIRLTYWAGGWAAPFTMEDFVDSRHPSRIAATLHPLPIVATPEGAGEPAFYTNAPDHYNGGEVMPVSVGFGSKGADAEVLEVVFTARWNADGLTIHVLLPQELQSETDYYHVIVTGRGNGYAGYLGDPGESSFSDRFSAGSDDLYPSASGHRLQTILHRALAPPCSIFCLLEISERSCVPEKAEDDRDAILRSVVFALHVECQENSG